MDKTSLTKRITMLSDNKKVIVHRIIIYLCMIFRSILGGLQIVIIFTFLVWFSSLGDYEKHILIRQIELGAPILSIVVFSISALIFLLMLVSKNR